MKSREGVARGRLGQDGRGNAVGSREMIVKVAGVSRRWVPRDTDRVGRGRRHAKVGGRRGPPCRCGGRTEDHYEDQGHCSDMSCA